jgi:predicted nucleotidyltransferase
VSTSRSLRFVPTALELTIIGTLRGTNRGLTGRDIARILDKPQRSVSRSLLRLTESGIARTEEAGRALLYRLNREHLAVQPIEQLLDLPAEFQNRLRDQIETWEVRPVHASIFGSLARGDDEASSDIDVLIVRPRQVDVDDEMWRNQLSELRDRVLLWTGRELGVSEVGEGELTRLRRERPPVVDDLSRDAITLYGQPAATLLRRRAR